MLNMPSVRRSQMEAASAPVHMISVSQPASTSQAENPPSSAAATSGPMSRNQKKKMKRKAKARGPTEGLEPDDGPDDEATCCGQSAEVSEVSAREPDSATPADSEAMETKWGLDTGDSRAPRSASPESRADEAIDAMRAAALNSVPRELESSAAAHGEPGHYEILQQES